MHAHAPMPSSARQENANIQTNTRTHTQTHTHTYTHTLTHACTRTNAFIARQENAAC